jgi:hypothetical protein
MALKKQVMVPLLCLWPPLSFKCHLLIHVVSFLLLFRPASNKVGRKGEGVKYVFLVLDDSLAVRQKAKFISNNPDLFQFTSDSESLHQRPTLFRYLTLACTILKVLDINTASSVGNTGELLNVVSAPKIPPVPGTK